MKKIICFAVALLMMFSCVFVVNAADDDKNADFDYEDGSVIAVIKHDISLERLNDFTIEDFDCDMIAEIKDLTPLTTDLENTSYNIDNFRKIFQLILKEPGKENVEKAIALLKNNDIIEFVEKNYIAVIYYPELNDTANEFDYADDCVVAVIKHDISLERLNDFTIEDFDCDMIAEIKDISPLTTDLENTTYNIENFHKMYKLILKEPGKENVEKAISMLKYNEIIEYVDRDYIMTIPVVDETVVSFEIGDVNMDGVVNLGDARLAIRIAANIEACSATARILADVDNSGKVTVSDARKLMRVIIGVESMDKQVFVPAI